MQKSERDVPLIHVLMMVGALKHYPGVLIAYANQDSLEQYAQVIFNPTDWCCPYESTKVCKCMR